MIARITLTILVSMLLASCQVDTKPTTSTVLDHDWERMRVLDKMRAATYGVLDSRLLPVEGTSPVEYVDQDIMIGTAFMVSSDGYVFTAAHVIKGDECTYSSEQYNEPVCKLRSLKDGVEYEAKILLFDDSRDIAVLKILDDRVSFPHLLFASDTERVDGRSVLALGTFGSPNGRKREGVSVGIAGQIIDPELPLREFYMQVYQGSSGGPVVLAASGEIVGMVVLVQVLPIVTPVVTSFPMGFYADHSYGVPVTALKDALTRARVRETSTEP